MRSNATEKRVTELYTKAADQLGSILRDHLDRASGTGWGGIVDLSRAG